MNRAPRPTRFAADHPACGRLLGQGPRTGLPRRALSALSSAALAAALAACSTAPDLPQPKLDLPTAYKHAAEVEAAAAVGRFQPAQPAEVAPRGAWWTVFGDERLNALQAQAEAANPGLAAATARVQSARSLLRASQADRLPQFGASLGGERQKLSPVDLKQPAGSQVEPSTAWRATLTASYELDLFQRVASSVDASAADAQAAEASLRSVLLALQADVAQIYFQLRTADAVLDLLERTLQLREENVRLTEKRYAAGDLSELDVARARTELATTRAEALAQRGERARLEHALALLLGRTPAAFDQPPAPLSADARVPNVPAGLPSTLLERRPDVAAAQARMMAANARIGQARAAIFPALNLTANGGYASYELEDLFKWDARTWLASAVLSLPLFDGGRNRAGIARAEAQLQESVADYRQAVLVAFGDVEDSLSDLASVRAQAETLEQGVVAARRAADLADKRYRAGEDSYLTLIDAQRNLLAVERQSVQLRGAWATRTVGLVRALGGGWQVPAAKAGS